MSRPQRNTIIGDRPDADRYDRMNLKNGWDLPPGEIPPATGKKRSDIRAWELLVLKSDEEYRREAEEARQKRAWKAETRRLNAARTILNHVNRYGYAGFEEMPEGPGTGPAGRTGPAVKEAAPAGSGVGEAAESGDAGSYQGIAIEEKSTWRKKRIRNLSIILAAVILLLGAADARIAFGSAITLADMEPYEKMEIQVEGLTEKPFAITVKDLRKMSMTKMKKPVHQGELTEDETPERGRAVGPTLDTFLAEYGRSRDEFRSMKVYTASEKSTAYVRTLREEEIILSVADGNFPLTQKEAPLRIAPSGAEPGEWSGGIRRIVFNEY